MRGKCHWTCELRVREREQFVWPRRTPRNNCAQRITAGQRCGLESHQKWLGWICNINQPRRWMQESTDSDAVSRARLEFQQIRFRCEGVWETDVNVINQTQVVLALLGREGDGVG